MSLLEQIPVLTDADFENPVLQLEDIALIHHSLTLDNPLTYHIFVGKREDLSEAEKQYYLAVAERLQNNEQLKYKYAIKNMHEPSFIEQEASK